MAKALFFDKGGFNSLPVFPLQIYIFNAKCCFLGRSVERSCSKRKEKTGKKSAFTLVVPEKRGCTWEFCTEETNLCAVSLHGNKLRLEAEGLSAMGCVCLSSCYLGVQTS